MIPRGISGKDVLLQATCKNCQVIINKFEHECMKILIPQEVRFFIGIEPRGNKRRNSKEVFLKTTYGKHQILLKDYPAGIVSCTLPFPAGITWNGSLSEQVAGKISITYARQDFQENLDNLYRSLNLSGVLKKGEKILLLKAKPPRGFPVDYFCRMLAKIALCYGVYSLGLDNFKPFDDVRNIILGKKPTYYTHYIETLPCSSNNLTQDLHHVSSPEIDENAIVSVTIRLFSKYSMDSHRVYIGESIKSLANKA
jgi:hypothetical protein